MGRKGISIRKKSGTRGSHTCTSRQQLVLPADQRSASQHPIAGEQNPISLEADDAADDASDDDANGDSAQYTFPQLL
jgi:hypothetical protein